MLGVSAVNIIVLSPGLLGLRYGESPLTSALVITLLLTSLVALLYAIYILLIKTTPAAAPVKPLETHEEYIMAVEQYKGIKTLKSEIDLSISQLGRLQQRMLTLLGVLNQRFDPNELTYKKFISVAHEVEKLFYLNIRSMLNRIRLFDEADYNSIQKQGKSSLPQRIIQEKQAVYDEFFSFISGSLATNEEILLKLDKLLVEISRLDSFDPAEIENMQCMQEIDSLIKQTKFYRD
ncbi:hypothetical protein HII30_04555 [Paenibacillus lemnae]|uniref:5-bromo-4-chloroindolyl phosphate hydrolysis protein n=2 Tax=Paenibacillus lemnae TaxID=1330551 RepID=A0A848M2E0_PAELE|nr:hypothetical protein [Paenibacillus lemnae]